LISSFRRSDSVLNASAPASVCLILLFISADFSFKFIIDASAWSILDFITSADAVYAVSSFLISLRRALMFSYEFRSADSLTFSTFSSSFLFAACFSFNASCYLFYNAARTESQEKHRRFQAVFQVLPERQFANHIQLWFRCFFSKPNPLPMSLFQYRLQPDFSAILYVEYHFQVSIVNR
jgi:hypothetical protein